MTDEETVDAVFQHNKPAPRGIQAMLPPLYPMFGPFSRFHPPYLPRESPAGLDFLPSQTSISRLNAPSLFQYIATQTNGSIGIVYSVF
jgi:hypothetical protein